MDQLITGSSFCPRCAAPVAAADTACAACGAPLHSAAPATSAATGLGDTSTEGPDSRTRLAAGTRILPPLTVGTRATDGLQPGEAFGNRYHIIKLLGVGGMGAVYQAWDDELGVAVAIKTIRPGTRTDPTAAHDAERRFKRELVLARQVTHPNVVRIHDLGEIDDVKYITMPFVKGDTLGELLAREGRLPVARALGIFRQVVSGMRAAHEKDVVHRDLKPANIMIEDGVAYIMDFGIARQVESATMMTVAGAVVGTLDYMAPEQATGQTVDQRADVYALGLILRDMLVGRSGRPDTDNPLSDLMQRLGAPPPPVRTVVPDLPEPVERLITRCLQIDPAARFEDAAALDAALAEIDNSGNLKPTTGPAPVVDRPAPTRAPFAGWLARAAVALVVRERGGGRLVCGAADGDARPHQSRAPRFRC